MGLNVLFMNKDAMEFAKLNYIRRHLFNDQSDLEWKDKVSKYKQEADTKYGQYGERWNGKPTEDITQADIDVLRKRYLISDDEYEYLYTQEESMRLAMIKVLVFGKRICD